MSTRITYRLLGSFCILACMTPTAPPSLAQPAPQPVRYGQGIDLARAKALAAIGQEEAADRGFAMAFSVALPSGDPILLEVMDGTQNASIAIAPAKARTAARFRKPTKALQDLVAAGNGAYAIADGALALEGGAPILLDGKVIGALGVSGGTSAQDGEVLNATLERLARRR